MNIAFVPVRCGSKSIQFKNIKLFCGKPLVYWSLSALQNSGSVDIIYLATDCDEIRRVVSKFNFSKVKIYDRSADNASDYATTESVMLEFIDSKDFTGQDLFLFAPTMFQPCTSAQKPSARKSWMVTSTPSWLVCPVANYPLWHGSFSAKSSMTP